MVKRKIGLSFGVITLFILSAVIPMTTGIDTDSEVDPLREYYGCYNLMEIPESIRPTISGEVEIQNVPKENIINSQGTQTTLLGPPMDSAWPMYCHDVRHTGRSPYSTENTTGIEKWRFDVEEWCTGSPVIDENDSIYIGASDLFGIYPNGTMKWMYDTEGGPITSAPAIDENGILYVGLLYRGRFFAIDTNNGKIIWNFWGTGNVWSSPAIGDDGVIYFGSEHLNPEIGIIYALYPNGTLKWKYKTNHVILSSPAIDDDGTIYCGSHDTYLYALNPNNGSLKWRYKTGHWIRTSPCIGDDGTIYVVSLDDHLHAVYPNGTMKWKTNVNAGTSPTIGQDGTIYCGYTKLYAINPADGSKKWSFDIGNYRYIRGATPCNSIDGTIYFGTENYNSEDGEIIAVNPDGTLRWRKMISDLWAMSAPAIGEDGTVYIGSCDAGHNNEWGYLYAFGYPGPNPLKPTISGPKSGKPNTPYTYSFTSIDPDEDQVSYYIEWGDGDITDWTDFQPSGEPYSESHIWTTYGAYTIRAKARDTDGYESDWGTLTVSMPRNKTFNMPFLNFLNSHPNLFPLLQKLLQQHWFGL